MSTEEQRAKWRAQSQARRDAAKKANGHARPDGDMPAFITLERCERFVIDTAEGTAVVLEAAELEELYQWWKVKRRDKHV